MTNRTSTAGGGIINLQQRKRRRAHSVCIFSIVHSYTGGIVDEQCFALNHFLSSKSQCNFANGDGVCPDFVGSPDSNAGAELVACKRVRTILNIFIFPIGKSDCCVAFP